MTRALKNIVIMSSRGAAFECHAPTEPLDWYGFFFLNQNIFGGHPAVG